MAVLYYPAATKSAANSFGRPLSICAKFDLIRLSFCATTGLMGTGEARIGLKAPKKAISGRNLLFWLAGFVGLVTLGRLVYCRNYNYDEISHAHMAWLVSIGEIPYQDFGANHFPFFWITLSPLMGLLPQGPVALVLLRVVALLLNAIFIISLGALITRELGPSQRAWAAACLAMVVFSPLPAEFLIEFRPDALAN